AVVDDAVVDRRAEVDFAPAERRRRVDLAAEVPDQAGLLVDGRLRVEVVVNWGDIAGPGNVHAPQVANARSDLAVRGHTRADVYLVVGDHWRRHDVVTEDLAVALLLHLFWIAIELPDLLAVLGLEAVKPGVAAGKDHLPLAVHLRGGG